MKRTPPPPLTIAALAIVMSVGSAMAQLQPVVPKSQRGHSDAERVGHHDAANIRTRFWNYGMVGDYPPNPGTVDLSVFHSCEVPKGSGMNYSDGITPFVLAKIKLPDSSDTYIMETGYRERQGISPFTNREMRFEPRPGYFQADPTINKARSPAISNDPRTWPSYWPDKQNDPDDPGWKGFWNGYFGKRASADQESFGIMDDDYYDAWPYYFPDSRDATRRGLGLRVQVRGLQWANPQAGNVIFWLYDITNESTTDYNDNIIFGLYMDSGVGGSASSQCDGTPESDDDNAYFDRSSGLNLVYTWDNYGHGVDLISNCDRTGYLGYAYLETPGNPFDGIDNDNDGITDESRDSGPGQLISGRDSIAAWVYAHYDTTKFFATYGPLEIRPAYRAGHWWTGDEDMDWVADQDDVGADGIADTHDTGEGDGIPTSGEPDFDKTDLTESDQIGLTGFKTSRIRSGPNNPDPNSDNVRFYTDQDNWPERLYAKFSDPYAPARFDSALAANYNIAFLFASGPFKLKAGKTERFSLALAYGADLQELRNTVGTVQQIYNANYQFAVPPPKPTATAEAGDRYVRLSWDDVAERGLDPVTHQFDFEGYRIYRSTDPEFRDLEVITTGRGNDVGLRKPLKAFDLVDGKQGYSRKTVEGVAYDLGSETGIQHVWTDTTVTNGQQYYYAVTAYDYGFDPVPYSDSLALFPSENPIAAITRTPRGGLILPTNVVTVRPNPRVAGFQGATISPLVHAAGDGSGRVDIEIVNSNEIANHKYRVAFGTDSPDSVKAQTYSLLDSARATPLFSHGADFTGSGIGPVGAGMLPLVHTIEGVVVDSVRSGWLAGSATTTRLNAGYLVGSLSPNLARPGYPDSIRIEFDDVPRDTGLVSGGGYRATPCNFRVFAETATGDQQLDFRIRDLPTTPVRNDNGILDHRGEYIDIATYSPTISPGYPQWTWRVQVDTLGTVPHAGDVWRLRLKKPLGPSDVFEFYGTAQHVDPARAQADAKAEPYVVPNPYVESASFEPARFAISGRGERRLEFRGVPQGGTVRIYSVRGSLVQTLRQDGSIYGIVPWNLRTKDNLDVAPGLYIFQVETPGMPTHVGKFAVIK